MPNERNSLAESFGVQLTGISRGEYLVERFVPHPITRNVGPLNYGRVRPFDKRSVQDVLAGAEHTPPFVNGALLAIRAGFVPVASATSVVSGQ
jgi:hypothetical protein